MEPDPRVKAWAERIGHQLRSAREAQGLRLKDLSRLSGSTIPTLSHIERGTRDVKLSTLIAIAGALRLSLASLFKDQQIISPSTDKSHIDGYQLDDD